jgi:hypothetical protein
MTAERTIETATATVELRDDGILVIRVKDGAEDTLQTVKETERAVLALAAETAPVMAVLGKMKGVTAEARAYVSQSDALFRRISKTALVVGSAVSRVIGNVFLQLNRSRTPTRLFTSETEAVAWLGKADG